MFKIPTLPPRCAKEERELVFPETLKRFELKEVNDLTEIGKITLDI